MSIELVRIDDRLIHGQVVMAWSKAVPIEDPEGFCINHNKRQITVDTL